MFDLALIQQCADPSIEIAIVERFIAEAGSDNPLAVAISSGDRIILPEPPQTPEAAMGLIQRFVGQAVVRVGVTQYPAGHGISDVTELNPDLVDGCGNIRMGTALFGKVYRIIAHARGDAESDTFRRAVAAWRTGIFEDTYVFGETEPGPLPVRGTAVQEESQPEADTEFDGAAPSLQQDPDPYAAGIRVDLTTLPGLGVP